MSNEADLIRSYSLWATSKDDKSPEAYLVHVTERDILKLVDEEYGFYAGERFQSKLQSLVDRWIYVRGDNPG